VWSKLLRIKQLTQQRRHLLVEALVTLAVVRLAMLLLPFHRIATWMGTVGATTPEQTTPNELLMAKEIGWAIGVLARRVPWDGRCLAQALAGMAMLRRRGLQGTISFGASRGEKYTFMAHAWLRFGPLLVTGGAEYERYNVFTTFAREQNETSAAKINQG
jgi:hypothetical protein